MKKNKKLLIIISIIAIIIIVMSLLFIKITKTDNNISRIKVGFYQTDSSITKSLESVITEICNENEIKVTYTELTNENLKNVNKYDLIFTPAGFTQKKISKLIKQNVSIPNSITNGMFSTAIGSVIMDENTIKAVPVVFDNLEINIETSEFKMSGLSKIATWQDIEEFSKIQKNKIDYPISYAGGNPILFLDILGALAEATDGISSYKNAVKIMEKYSKEFNIDQLITELFFTDNAPLYSSLEYLKFLINKGYINPNSQFLTKQDIESYITNRLTNVVFTTLSDHRKMNSNAISRYSTIYLPSKMNTNYRSFTANATYAIPTNNTDNCRTVLESLFTSAKQGELCCYTGLSPVFANCMTPDKQSDDARYWIAATEPPLAGLGHEVEFTNEQLQQILNEINKALYY